MKGWADTGWALLSAQAVPVALRPGALSAGYVMHSFFWCREEDT